MRHVNRKTAFLRGSVLEQPRVVLKESAVAASQVVLSIFSLRSIWALLGTFALQEKISTKCWKCLMSSSTVSLQLSPTNIRVNLWDTSNGNELEVLPEKVSIYILWEFIKEFLRLTLTVFSRTTFSLVQRLQKLLLDSAMVLFIKDVQHRFFRGNHHSWRNPWISLVHAQHNRILRLDLENLNQRANTIPMRLVKLRSECQYLPSIPRGCRSPHSSAFKKSWGGSSTIEVYWWDPLVDIVENLPQIKPSCSNPYTKPHVRLLLLKE